MLYAWPRTRGRLAEAAAVGSDSNQVTQHSLRTAVLSVTPAPHHLCMGKLLLQSCCRSLRLSSAVVHACRIDALFCTYRKHLEALLAKEQLDTAERDGMIEAALAEQNAKRDAELAARMAARKQLLLEVTRGQLDQIQQHQQARRDIPVCIDA